MNFKIDDSYLTSVSILSEGSIYAGRKDLTDDELVKILQGKDRWSSFKNDDHPEFKKLREELGILGYISIERGWWNGDSVLKPFKLNGFKFEIDEKFPSGAAMMGHLKFKI